MLKIQINEKFRGRVWFSHSAIFCVYIACIEGMLVVSRYLYISSP